MTFIFLIVALLVGVILVTWGIYLLVRQGDAPRFDEGIVSIGDHRFRVAVADAIGERTQGLSGVSTLGEDEGMWFVFPIPAAHSFWMKDMRFPLDIVWVRDGRIVQISEHVPPPTSPNAISLPTYAPDMPADRVLEINAGLSSRYGFFPGQQVETSFAPQKRVY